MAPGLECVEGNGTKRTAAGPSSTFFSLVCLPGRSDIFSKHSGASSHWLKGQGQKVNPQPQNCLPSLSSPWPLCLHSKDCVFLHCSWGRNQARDLSGPCAPLGSDMDCDSRERRKFRWRAWSGKASWVWWFHSQATSLNQNLTFTTISYWFWHLPLIWWQLLGGGYGLEEILLNCRQFYCTHQK